MTSAGPNLNLEALERELLGAVAGAADLARSSGARRRARQEGPRLRADGAAGRAGAGSSARRSARPSTASKARVGEALEARKSALERERALVAAGEREAPTSRCRCVPARSQEGRIHPVSQVFDEVRRDLRRHGLRRRRGAGHRDRRSQLHQAQHPARASRAPGARHLLFPSQGPTARACCCARTRARCRSAR